MEVFKIRRDDDFDFEMWVEKLDVKPGDILLLKANREMSEANLDLAKEQFVDIIKEQEERFEGVKLFIIPDPGEIDLSVLTDIQLEEMGLMKIEKENMEE